MFIVFEGLDGSGSSTQASLLKDYLLSKGKSVFLTKEPTENVLGKLIRNVLQHKTKISPQALQLLFCADRAEHIENEIIPSVTKDKIVISDRYYFSTIAFGSLYMDRTWLENINSGFIKPDITFLLKLDPEECIRRINKRGNKKELFEKAKILKKVWNTYDELSKKSGNIVILDASKSIENIHNEIIAYISQYI